MSKRLCNISIYILTFVSVTSAGVVPKNRRSTKPMVDTQSVVAPSEIIDLGGTWQTTSMKQKESVFGPKGHFVLPTADAKWTPTQIPGKHFSGWVCWYRRKINIPKAWTGKRVTLRVRGALYKTEIYWNGRLVHSQLDGNYAYELDVTPYLQPGGNNELMIGTAGYNVGKTLAAKPYIVDPYRGIFMPVSLIVSDPITITDIFAKPSVKQGKLDLDVTVDFVKTGKDDQVQKPRTLTLRAWVSDDGKIVNTFPLKEITLAPGERKTVDMSVDWKDAELWWPHRPYLYRAGVELCENGVSMGGKTIRFGFREFEIRKHLIYMNGKKLFTRRQSILPYRRNWLDGQVARKLFDTYRKRGYNAIRTHYWVHDYVNEMADEEGFLVFSEMPMRGHLVEDRNSPAWRITREHVEHVVRQGRNHPSVLMWVICNEEWYYAKDKLAIYIDRLVELGNLAMEIDPTRTVHYDGDKDLDGRAPTASLHYPWQVCKPSRMLPGRAYWLDEKRKPWMGWVWQKDKPLSIGEYVFPFYSLRLPHGMTYLAGDDVYVNPDGWIRAWLKAIKWLDEGYAHAEVFCLNPWDVPARMYEMGPVVRPIRLAMRQKYTTFFSGEKVRRTFHVYNHTLVDRKFILVVRLGKNGKAIFNKRVAIPLPGGESKTLHVSIPLPKVTAKTEYRFTTELLEDGKPATDGEVDTWSVFPRLTKKDWPQLPIAVIASDPEMLSYLQKAGMNCTAPKNIQAAIASGAKLILLAGLRISPEDGKLLVNKYVSGGGRVVMINTLNDSWLPGAASISSGGSHFSNHAFSVVSEHEALRNLLPSDLALWRPDTLVCSKTFFKPTKSALRVILEAGGPLGLKWAPLMELSLGRGRFILCQMQIIDRLRTEPAAGYLLVNLLRAALRPAKRPGGMLRAYLPDKSPMPKLLKTLKVATTPKSANAAVTLIDGSLPDKKFRHAVTTSLPKSKTIVLHNLTPTTAKIAADILDVPIVLKEKKNLGQVVRAGRDPLIDGLSNHDFWWQTGQYGNGSKKYRIKTTTTLCQYALDSTQSPGWRVLTKPAALAVREKDGHTLVLDQILWARGGDVEPARCRRIGSTLLSNLGVSIGGQESTSVRQLTFLDLRNVVNRGFVDEVAGDGKGGWTDRGPNWDMRFFPVNLVGTDRNGLGCPKEEFPKRSTMGLCDFQLIDPETNNDQSCLVLRGGKDKSRTIPVGHSAEAIWFLHAGELGWNVTAPIEVAEVVFTYEDGTTVNQAFHNGIELDDWRLAKPIRLGEQGWQGYCVQHDPVSLYTYRWENPHPKKRIRQMTITPKNDKTYILTAVTIEHTQ